MQKKELGRGAKSDKQKLWYRWGRDEIYRKKKRQRGGKLRRAAGGGKVPKTRERLDQPWLEGGGVTGGRLWTARKNGIDEGRGKEEKEQARPLLKREKKDETMGDG